MEARKGEDKRSRTLATIAAVLVFCSIGCGGGTYGTGPEASSQRVVVLDASGEGLSGALIRVAGVDERFVTSPDGVTDVVLNSALRVQLIRVADGPEGTSDFYVDSTMFSDPETPLLLTLGARGQMGEYVFAECAATLASWEDYLTAPDEAFSASILAAIERTLNDESLACEERAEQIAQIVFE